MMELTWKLIILLCLSTLSAFILHLVLNDTITVDRTTASVPRNADQEQQISVANSSHLALSTISSHILTHWTIDFLGLFILKVHPLHNVERSKTGRVAKSSIKLDFGSRPVPFLNIPPIPALEIRHKEAPISCDNRIDKRQLNCLDPELHLVGRPKEVSDNQPSDQSKGKLVKKFKFNITAENHEGYFNFSAYELQDKYIIRELQASLRRNNLTNQLVDFTGDLNSRRWTTFGFSIQAEIFMTSYSQYTCGGNIYIASNVSRPFASLRGDKIPRYARHVEYLLGRGLEKGMIVTSPGFVCKKRKAAHSLELVVESTFKIDFIRSQYFPFTTLQITSSTLPNQYVLDSIIKIEQSRNTTDSPTYRTKITFVAHTFLLLGHSEASYARIVDRSFNTTEETSLVDYLQLDNFPERGSRLRYISSRTLASNQHTIDMFTLDSRYTESNTAIKLFSWFHDETKNADHISVTMSFLKDWKRLVEEIVNDPLSVYYFPGLAVSQVMTKRSVPTDMFGRPTKQSAKGGEYDEAKSNVKYDLHIFGFLKLTRGRSISRSLDKLRLLRDKRRYTLGYCPFVSYTIKLRETEVVREEQVRHCDELPEWSSLNRHNFDCVPSRILIKNDTYRRLGVDTGKSSLDDYIKYYTLKIENYDSSGFIDMFPYKDRVLAAKINSILVTHGLTSLDFIEDHFRFGGHAEGRYSFKESPQNNFEFSANFVWALNSSSDVFDDELVKVESLTTTLLSESLRFRGLNLKLDELGRTLEGHLIEVTNFTIKFQDNSQAGMQNPARQFLSNATLITREQFPYVYYHQDIYSLDRLAFNYSGTISQTQNGSLYNTTCSLVSSSTNTLGSFMFNRTTTSSNQEPHESIADQILFLYPHFDIWFMARNNNETTDASRYYGRFSEGEEPTILSKMAANNSKTDIFIGPHIHDDYWTVRFKVKRNVYEHLRHKVQRFASFSPSVRVPAAEHNSRFGLMTLSKADFVCHLDHCRLQ